MAVTLREIAEDSGLSVQTVSNVLSDKSHLFRPETRSRVLAAATKLGYRPNASAKAIRSGRFNAVSLLLSNVSNRSTVAIALLDGVHDALQQKGMTLSVSRLPDDKLTDEGFVPQILQQQMSDGLLINYTDHIPQRLIELIRSHGIPSIWINSKQAVDCVYPDDIAAGHRATRMLIEAGHRRIAYVDCTWGTNDIEHAHYSVLDREAGYRKAMREAGLKVQVERSEHHLARQERFAWIRSKLAGPNAPTGLVVYGSGLAVPAMAAVRSLELRVASDISIVTFHDTVVFDGVEDVTTLILPQAELGRRAVKMLISRIAGEKPAAAEAVAFDLREAGTIGPPAHRE